VPHVSVRRHGANRAQGVLDGHAPWRQPPGRRTRSERQEASDCLVVFSFLLALYNDVIKMQQLSRRLRTYKQTYMHTCISLHYIFNVL
jgi:hypothetical protein